MTKAIKKPFLGILMLDTSFIRLPGDAGNVDSYRMPAKIYRVKGAFANEIVTDHAPNQVCIDAFCQAAQDLENQGATAIISTCGFLIHIQKQISHAVNIPVIVSALSLYPLIKTATENKPIAIMTASKLSLTDDVLRSIAIAPEKVVVVGFEDDEIFNKVILSPNPCDAKKEDVLKIKSVVEKKAIALKKNYPQIGAVLLECGNLPPYTAMISKRCQRPVYSIIDVANLIFQDPKV